MDSRDYWIVINGMKEIVVKIPPPNVYTFAEDSVLPKKENDLFGLTKDLYITKPFSRLLNTKETGTFIQANPNLELFYDTRDNLLYPNSYNGVSSFYDDFLFNEVFVVENEDILSPLKIFFRSHLFNFEQDVSNPNLAIREYVNGTAQTEHTHFVQNDLRQRVFIHPQSFYDKDIFTTVGSNITFYNRTLMSYVATHHDYNASGDRDNGFVFIKYSDSFIENYDTQIFSDNGTILSDILETGCFMHMVYADKKGIRYIDCYQAVPEGTHTLLQEGVYYNHLLGEFSDRAANNQARTYVFLGRVFTEPSIGFVFIPLNGIAVAYLFLQSDRSFLNADFPRNGINFQKIDSPYGNVSVRSTSYINANYLFADIMNYNFNKTNVLKTIYTYRESNQLFCEGSSVIRVYSNACTDTYYSLARVYYKKQNEFIISPRHLTYNFENNINNFYINPEVVSYDRNNFRVILREDGINKNAGNFWTVNKELYYLQEEQNQDTNINSLENQIRPYPNFLQAGIYHNQASSVLTVKIRVERQTEENYSKKPFLYVGIAQQSSGNVERDYIRVPFNIKIPKEDIISVNISKGSPFNESMTATIVNKDNKYDVVENLTDYNIMFVVDYTDLYNITGAPILNFVGRGFTAQELGLPQHSVVVFRGVSDFETPLTIEHKRIYQNSKISFITLNAKGDIHRLQQAVPIMFESINYLSHNDAVRYILSKVGITDNMIIEDTLDELYNFRLIPPLTQLKDGFYVEPPNSFADLLRKIINEYTGYILLYSHAYDKYYYHPRYFNYTNRSRQPPWLRQYVDAKIFLEDRKYKEEILNNRNPFSYLVISDITETKIRPICNNLIVYFGPFMPLGNMVRHYYDLRSLYDPNYEYYIGKIITVATYYPIATDSRLADYVGAQIALRLMTGKRRLSFTGIGIPAPLLGTFCFVQGFGPGIIKNSEISVSESTGRIIHNSFEVELSNYRNSNNEELIVWFDEI